MKREVFLAVEATGLDTHSDRVVEIVALEAKNSALTGVGFHVLLDPQHPFSADAARVTGYDDATVFGLPLFRDVAQAFVNFVEGSTLIVFNPGWAYTMIDAELARADMPPLSKLVHAQKDIRSKAMKLDLDIRLTTEKLSTLFDCRAPVQACSETWKDCFLMAQIFPHLDRVKRLSGMNIVSLETSVPIHSGTYGVPYIEIGSIPEPWQSQFVRYLCGGELSGNEHIQTCHHYLWKQWLDTAPVDWPELAPTQLEELPFSWPDMRDAMKLGQQRAQIYLRGKFIRFRDDLEREMRYQAALATFGAQERTLQEAFIRGFRRGLKKATA